MLYLQKTLQCLIRRVANFSLSVFLSHHKMSRERIRESDLRDYECRYYKDLKRNCYKLQVSKSEYRCPFCTDKRYSLRELLKHASRFVRDSRSGRVKELAQHSALKSYIERYLDVGVGSQSQPDAKALDVGAGSQSQPDAKALDVGAGSQSQPDVKALDVGAGSQSQPDAKDCKDKDQLFVWPWMGVVANIATKFENGKYVAESGSKLREEFAQKGFHPLRVNPLWNRKGHSGLAIVEFGKDWEGLTNALNFERSFETEHCGKRDYLRARHKGDRLFGWVARDDDYHSKSLIGEHLRKNGDLKTVSDKEAEDKKRTSLLVSGLANTLKIKNEKLEQVCSKFEDINESLNRVMDQKEEMIINYHNEIKKMQQKERDLMQKVFMDHEKARLLLQAQKKELLGREKDLQKRASQNDNERKKLQLKKKSNEMAIMEQKKADEKMMHLAEQQKKEKEKLHKKIHELEKELDAKQALELKIEQLKGAVQVMEHMKEEDDVEKRKIDAIKLDLQDKEEELEGMEQLLQTLVVRERKTNDELQDARKELINRLRNSSSRVNIGVKKMGELDGKPFVTVAKRKFAGEEADVKAVEFCSQWEAYLRDPNWHPFKIVTDKGITKEIFDDEDEKLRTLKDELGDEVFVAVTTALVELNNYNPSGRYPIPELWNFKEKRKALLKEGVSHIIRQWRLSKRRKT
ncbi:hypothetical protein RJT34_28443 [Clitoria ternatea]|uniref:XH/XS domain-containing protein n=1 Tax=Clitoria ternatea TaxID=43366 RepID=A0AAN9ICK1_CLITE